MKSWCPAGGDGLQRTDFFAERMGTISEKRDRPSQGGHVQETQAPRDARGATCSARARCTTRYNDELVSGHAAQGPWPLSEIRKPSVPQSAQHAADRQAVEGTSRAGPPRRCGQGPRGGAPRIRAGAVRGSSASGQTPEEAGELALQPRTRPPRVGPCRVPGAGCPGGHRSAWRGPREFHRGLPAARPASGASQRSLRPTPIRPTARTAHGNRTSNSPGPADS